MKMNYTRWYGAEIKKLYLEGMGCPSIAKKLKMGTETVRKILKNLGVIKPKSEGNNEKRQ